MNEGWKCVAGVRELQSAEAFSIALPTHAHEHWCDECRDAWEHSAADCSVAAAYECPGHQPGSGSASGTGKEAMEGTGGVR